MRGDSRREKGGAGGRRVKGWEKEEVKREQGVAQRAEERREGSEGTVRSRRRS